eukprot:1084718-Rhodomonas_salina.1
MVLRQVFDSNEASGSLVAHFFFAGRCCYLWRPFCSLWKHFLLFMVTVLLFMEVFSARFCPRCWSAPTWPQSIAINGGFRAIYGSFFKYGGETDRYNGGAGQRHSTKPVYAAAGLRARYATSGTDAAYGATYPRVCYTMCVWYYALRGNDVAYAATPCEVLT